MTGLAPGSRVAGYVLERLVGVGGMAAVYQARDERLGRVVALKLLAGDEAVRTRFVREARAVAAVDHPHIIPVYAAGEADGMQYIAMRFVAGDTLGGIIRVHGALPPRRAAAFISPVASALDAAHAAGLVHRDVKPGNILVDARRGGPEHPYLTDFGIARAMLSAGTLTVAGQFLGTPDYAAPEQVNGHPVDGRADQYALACVAFELLSGTVPFKREMPMAVLYAHLSTPPPRLTAIRQDLPPAVDDVLARALAKDSRRALPGLRRLRRRSAPRGPRPRPLRPVKGGAHPDAADDRPGPGALGPVPPVQIPHRPCRSTWTAVVTADRDYYDRVRAANDSDRDGDPACQFPGDVPGTPHPADRRRDPHRPPQPLEEHRAGNRPDRSPQRSRRVQATRQAGPRIRRKLDGCRPRLGERHPGQRPRPPLGRLGPHRPRRPHPPRRLDQDHHHRG